MGRGNGVAVEGQRDAAGEQAEEDAWPEHVDRADAPGADGQELTFKNDLTNYLRGQAFPTCPMAAKNNLVRMMSGSGPIASSIGGTSMTHSWVYQYETGEFYINSSVTASDGVTTYDQF